MPECRAHRCRLAGGRPGAPLRRYRPTTRQTRDGPPHGPVESRDADVRGVAVGRVSVAARARRSPV